jgi:transcriptional regulator with XRE-family HTH domain
MSGFTERLATVRRFLSVAMGRDLNQVDMEHLLGLGAAAWSRYENGENRPRRDKIERLAAICAEWGMPYFTAAWIDYGEGEGPPKIGVHKKATEPRPAAKRARKQAPRASETKRRKQG